MARKKVRGRQSSISWKNKSIKRRTSSRKSGAPRMKDYGVGLGLSSRKSMRVR